MDPMSMVGGMAGGYGQGVKPTGGGSQPLQPKQPVQFQPMQQQPQPAPTQGLVAAVQNLKAANTLAAMQPNRSIAQSAQAQPATADDWGIRLGNARSQSEGNDMAAAGRAAGIASHYQPPPPVQQHPDYGALQASIAAETAREQQAQAAGVNPQQLGAYNQTQDYVNQNANYTPPALLTAVNGLSTRSFPNG